MATLIEVINCSYEKFNELRDKLISANRFGLMNAEYIREHNYARFWVHDAKYIPISFYITGPNFDKERIDIHIPDEFRTNFVEPAIEKYEQE